MIEKQFFYGLTPEDFSQLLEMLAIFAMAICIIVVVIIPLFHMAQKALDDPVAFVRRTARLMPSNPTKKEYVIAMLKIAFDDHLKSLRQTLGPTLKWAGLGIIGTIVFIKGITYIKSASFCREDVAACDVWIGSAFALGSIVIGLYLLMWLVRQYKRKSNTFMLAINGMFLFSTGGYIVQDGWTTLFGGNCPQSSTAFIESSSQASPSSPPSPFSSGAQVHIIRSGWSIPPRKSGYCIAVEPAMGARATVVSYQPKTPDHRPFLTVRWNEQSFRELSWLGIVLRRKPNLKPFLSNVPPFYFKTGSY